MRTFVTLLSLALCAAPASAQYALVGGGTGAAVSTDVTIVTTAPFDATGTGVVWCAVSSYRPSSESTATVTDTANNVYHKVAERFSSTTWVRLYAANAASGGPDFSVTYDNASNNYPSMACLAFSRGPQQNAGPAHANGAVTNGATSLPTGEIAPDGDGALLIAALSTGSTTTVGLTGGFSTPLMVPHLSGNHIGVGLAWQVQPTAAPLSATWTTPASAAGSTVLLSYNDRVDIVIGPQVVLPPPVTPPAFPVSEWTADYKLEIWRAGDKPVSFMPEYPNYVNDDVVPTPEMPFDLYPLMVNSPDALWRLGADATANDSTEHARHGAYVGGVTLGVPTLTGYTTDTTGAASFDGVDDHITMGDVDAFEYGIEGNGFPTPTFWIKPAGQPSAEQWVLGKYDHATRTGWYVSLLPSGHVKFVGRAPDGQSDAFMVTTEATVTDGRAHHVSCGWSGVDLPRTAWCFVDAVLSGIGDTTSRLLSKTDEPFLVAMRNDGAAHFAGTLDEIGLYPYALSGGRVSSHYVFWTRTWQPFPVAQHVFRKEDAQCGLPASMPVENPVNPIRIEWDDPVQPDPPPLTPLKCRLEHPLLAQMFIVSVGAGENYFATIRFLGRFFGDYGEGSSRARSENTFTRRIGGELAPRVPLGTRPTR